MAAASPDTHARARKNQATALRVIAQVGQNTIADAIGVSAATVSRYLSEPEGLERACRVLAAAGMKVVPAGMQCFPPRKVEILMELARDHLNQSADGGPTAMGRRRMIP